MVHKADVGRFDGEFKTIAFNEGNKVEVVLSKAGIELHEGECVNSDNGDEVSLSDTAINGETYNIVGNYKQGAVVEDDVSKFDKTALADAIGDIDEERAEIQKEKAKDVLREILGRKDVIEFNLEKNQEELKAIDKELKVFYKK